MTTSGLPWPTTSRLPARGVCHNAVISINEEVFIIDLNAIPLGGYDVVLDTQWLATLGPILWDFGLLTMSFWRHDHQVQWSGLHHTMHNVKLHVVDGCELLDALLQEFDGVFSEPTSLLPTRTRGHRIHLPRTRR